MDLYKRSDIVSIFPIRLLKLFCLKPQFVVSPTSNTQYVNR